MCKVLNKHAMGSHADCGRHWTPAANGAIRFGRDRRRSRSRHRQVRMLAAPSAPSATALDELRGGNLLCFCAPKACSWRSTAGSPTLRARSASPGGARMPRDCHWPVPRGSSGSHAEAPSAGRPGPTSAQQATARADMQCTKCVRLPASERNTRALLYPHRIRPAPKRDPRPSAQSGTNENHPCRFCGRRERGAASPPGGRRKGPPRNARPRLCRFALAPAGRDATGGSGSSRRRGRAETQDQRSQSWPNSAASIRASCNPNPDNPRRTPCRRRWTSSFARLDQGGRHHPAAYGREKDGPLDDHCRRSPGKAADRADFAVIDVLVCDADEAADAMRAAREPDPRLDDQRRHLARHRRPSRAQGWNEQAIADALALPVRTVKRLKLLAHLHPPMLDVMAPGTCQRGSAAHHRRRNRDEQAQVWKKHKPKKGTTSPGMRSRARSPNAAFRSRPQNSTTSGASLRRGLGGRSVRAAPARTAATPPMSRVSSAPSRSGCRTTCRSAARCCRATSTDGAQLPKKAEHVYGKPGKNDLVGHYLDPLIWRGKTIAYRLPEQKKREGRQGPDGNRADPEAPTSPDHGRT